MGFSKVWCNLILQCISTTNLSITMNGYPCGFFKPTRGLRQGDPLSPYLFLFCMESLSRTITHAENPNLLRGHRINNHAPSITHLLFADDCLLFCEASTHASNNLVKLFSDFGKASGQLINLSKSGVFFSAHTDPDIMNAIQSGLNVQSIPLSDKYLGSPLFTNRSKIKCFEPMVENMKSRILGWQQKTITIPGKTVMIKTVTSSMSIYQMSCFKLPKKICKDINKIQRDFWWGKT